MPTRIGEVEAMIAFAHRVWGIKPSSPKKVSKPKKKSKKESHPRGMP